MELIFKVCSLVSKEDIAKDILTYTKGSVYTCAERDKVLSIVSRAIRLKNTSENIYNTLNKLKSKSLKEIENAICVKSDNLLGKYHTHKLMHISSNAPIIDFDETEILDIFEEVEYEFFLERRASFSMDNLQDYVDGYKYMFSMYDKKRVFGGIKYALDMCGGEINTLLFMFDYMVQDFRYKDKKIINVLDILNYVQKAQEKHNSIAAKIDRGTFGFKDRRWLCEV